MSTDALRAAKSRHDLHAMLLATGPKERTPAIAAYLLDCIATTVATAEHLSPFNAYMLGKTAARIAAGKRYRFGSFIQFLTLPCGLCGRASTVRVGLRGYCARHTEAATIDRRRCTTLRERAVAEESRSRRAFAITVEGSHKHHQARGRLSRRKP